jgi:micrococcal nuclease
LGYATVLTVSPNVKYADKFILLQQEARKHKRGLWGVPVR